MKNDKLKKHHFWLLFGLVPLFVMIAVLLISSGVGGAIDDREAKIKKSVDEIKGKSNPKPNVLLAELEKTAETVKGKQGGLWQANWERQKALYQWPKSDAFVNFQRKEKDGKTTDVRLDELKFGDNIVSNFNQFDEFRKERFYLSQYSTADMTDKPAGVVGMADAIAPTQFNGGWQKILRHVDPKAWTQFTLTSDQVWLLMEDIWVQRSMLEAIRSVNEQMSDFHRVKYEKDGQVIDDPAEKGTQNDPLRRKFRSRTWEVALEVHTKGNKQYLTGSLTNITDRLQVLGIGKTLTLKVWLQANLGPDGKPLIGPDGKPDVKGIEPVEFRIGSEFLPGKGGKKTIIVRSSPTDKNGREVTVDSNVVTIQPEEGNDKDLEKYPNLLPPGKQVAEIAKIEQVFDTQTVPVRRIDAMALGYPDSHWAKLGALYPPKFITIEAAPDATQPIEGGGGTSLQGPPSSIAPSSALGGGKPKVGGGTGGDPRGSGSGTATQSSAGGGTVATVIDANKRRYVEVNEQVRRMPVGIVVVVDQAYIEDVLLAFANSPLRFQVTQVNWKRFRDGLGTDNPGSGSPSGGNVYLSGSGAGSIGKDFGPGGDPDSRYNRGQSRPPGSGAPGIGSDEIVGKGGSSNGPPRGPLTTGPGSSFGGYGSFGGSGASTAVSEAQLTSGLVELSVYGIVSLYERYQDPTEKKEDAPKVEKKDEKPKEEKKDEKPKDGMPPTKTEPKKRVRRRAD